MINSIYEKTKHGITQMDKFSKKMTLTFNGSSISHQKGSSELILIPDWYHS